MNYISISEFYSVLGDTVKAEIFALKARFVDLFKSATE
jgi:hypothetical protein